MWAHTPSGDEYEDGCLLAGLRKGVVTKRDTKVSEQPAVSVFKVEGLRYVGTVHIYHIMWRAHPKRGGCGGSVG